MPTPRRQAVIITVLPLERDAVLEHLREVREEPPLRGSVYRKGIFDERSDPWEVVVAEIGAGNEGAAAEAERVIATTPPRSPSSCGSPVPSRTSSTGSTW